MRIQIFNITWINVSDNLIAWYWRDLEIYDPGNENRFWLRDYVRAILGSIENLTNRLFETAFNINKKVTRTGQNAVLEITLNDEFDSVTRQIFLSDAEGLTNFNYDFYQQGETDPTPQSFYLEGEVDPAPKTFFTGGESAGALDFHVNIPNTISVNVPRVQAIVNTYKPSGKRYDLIFF
jgi:hypothetical protein